MAVLMILLFITLHLLIFLTNSWYGQFSFQARFFDLVQPFYMLAENPITGVGLDDEQFIKTRQKTKFSLNLQAVDFSNVNDKGSTNSIMFFLAAAGIPFTLFFVMLYYQNLVPEKRKWFSFSL